MSVVELCDIGLPLADSMVSLLAEAFCDDPLTRYFFAGRGTGGYRSRCQAFFRYTCGTAQLGKQRLIGVRAEGELVGVAVLEESATSRASLIESVQVGRSLLRMLAVCGLGAGWRMLGYLRLTERHKPAGPHLHLLHIAVKPAQQGRGIGRILLDEIHRHSAASPRSTGVALETEKQSNVDMYERFGYRVTARLRLGPVRVWVMFRSNQPGQA